ncbi:MAG: TatD family hydrolase [Gammaproteobacteria bacterium]|nr:TatD family hydrolase [Gammaproteobacteria bacterium]
MQLVDSHCHIDFEPLRTQLPDVLHRAAENEVAYMLCVAVNLEDFPRISRLAAEKQNIFASVGVHPNSTDCHEPDADELAELAAAPHVVALGETGLDYFRTEGAPAWQRERFANHIEAARRARKPLIIHTRAAAKDTMEMLESLRADEAGAVMHCFAEDWPTASRALDLGFYISFSGILTFKNAGALREVAKKTPPDRMLVETDAPYLAPEPHRGKTNEPALVRHTAARLAELRGDSLENIAAVTTENFFRLFAAARPGAKLD